MSGFNKKNAGVVVVNSGGVFSGYANDLTAVIYDLSPRPTGRPLRYWLRVLRDKPGKCRLPRGWDKIVGIKEI